ncbi:exopolysaccharide Pel transporter PelG [Burkholderia alba]|uniref:exopolysaccharide Pel transporter PelG n=1 Tax=Burkholderia alba TaxID=2683677 RepID=UPI002B05C218|nr:exopolysaccharide Pel transporter PelG [Burkholderia alba]
MAGIGFELRRMLKRDTLTGLVQAYTYAGLIGAGPWVLSIVGMLLIGVLSLPFVVPTVLITQFQVSVTHLIAGSLILTGPFQLTYTRFTSDRLFAGETARILPNYHGAALLVSALAFALGVPGALLGFDGESAAYRLLLVAGFVVMSQIWLATIFLSGMKQYRAILAVFLIGYTLTAAGAVLLARYGLGGLLLGFVAGQTVLLVGLLALIYRDYGVFDAAGGGAANGDAVPPAPFLAFDFLGRRDRYPALMATGLLYNLGVWADKIMFWYAPGTGQQVIGPFYASVIYDIPVFLAYLAILPGMAVFLMRIETDFVEHFEAFYDGVRGGASLQHIERARDAMIDALRIGFFDIVKVQAVTALVLFTIGAALLAWLRISPLYLPLLHVDVIAASLQVLFMGIVNVFFYLDKRKSVLVLSAAFLVLNVLFTWATLVLTPAWYGYGFALALLVVVVVGMAWLDRKLERLEYETFMLQ